VDDQREHYGDPAPDWVQTQAPDPTGLRPCDRAHLAGWVGVFIALILLGIGIGYVRVLRSGLTVGDLMYLSPIGASFAAFGFAGVYLISRSLTDRPPTGAMVLVCNAIVVGPFVVTGVLVILGLLPGTVAGFTTALPYFQSYGAFAGVFVILVTLELVLLWYTGDGRRHLRLIRAWLDPTDGQWW
jgi:hypothetical protein